MPTHRSLVDVLRHSYDGGAWHGPALADVLDGVDVATARARPIAGAHTIWELTHHVAAWTREVTRRLGGARPGLPSEGDWPDPATEPDPDALAADWAALGRELSDARDALVAAVGRLSDDRLREPFGSGPDDEPGATLTVEAMLIGLAEHNAYHGGQITLLRRATRGTQGTLPAGGGTITES